MLLDDHLSSYVTKPRATNTISVSAILMCYTESLFDVDSFLLRSPIYLLPGAAEPGGLGGLEPPQLYQLYAVEFLLSVMFTLSLKFSPLNFQLAPPPLLTLNNLQDVFRRRTRHGNLECGNPLGRPLRNGRSFLLVPEW